LQEKLRVAALDQEVDDGLCGFKVGDRVSTAGGPDEHGPWEKFGNGVVVERGRRPGYLVLSFENCPDTHQLKANNLTNLTDESRSGTPMITNEGVQLHKLQRKIADYTFEDKIFKVGDHVALANGGVGVLVKEGKTPDQVLVRFGDLGIRSARKAQLKKVKCTTAEKIMEAEKAAIVDESDRKRFTLSLKEACGGFSEASAWSEDVKVETVEEDVIVIVKPGDEDPNFGFKVGHYVKVLDQGNPMWKDIGVGCIRSCGKALGTLDVQFDSGGETWCMQASMLKRVSAPDRKFRKLGEEIVPESGVGREHQSKVHKVSALCA